MLRALAVSCFFVILAANATTAEAVIALAVVGLASFVIGGLLALGDLLR